MKTFRTMTAWLVLVILLFCFPSPGEAVCDSHDETTWEKYKDQVPTADSAKLSVIIGDLTNMKNRCHPKTRFSASVVQLLFKASFRQDELDRAQRRLNRYYSRLPIRR